MKRKIWKFIRKFFITITFFVLLDYLDYLFSWTVIYDHVPVVIKYGYYKAKYLAKVKGERLWYDYIRKFFDLRSSRALDLSDSYVYIADEYRPILKDTTTVFDAIAGQRMFIGYAVQEQGYSLGSGINFRIDLTIGDQHSVLFESDLYPHIREQDRGWKNAEIDLSRYVGKRVQLSFIINSRNRSAARYGFFSRPFFYGSQESPKRMNVVLIILDTLGAKHLNCYGYRKRETSPFIDQLAREGALFLNAASNAPVTFSSHMALLTGLYPSITGVSYRNCRGQDFREETMPSLPKGVSTFPEVLAKNGYYTTAYTSGYLMAGGVGFYRGFYRMIYASGLTREIATRVENWINLEKKEPFFIYFHSFEPHAPYQDDRFIRAEGITTMGDMRNEALYDGDIRSSDDAVRDFLAFLKKQDLLQNTLITLTADHGEEFGDHFPIYHDGHGESLFDEEIRVPLIFHHPSIPPEQFQKQVQLVDIRPTLMDFLGILDSHPVNGVSLKERLLSGKEDNIREIPAFAEDTIYGPEWKMLRTSAHKILYLPTPWNQRSVGRWGFQTYMQYAFVPRVQLFDLRFDPEEKKNLYSDSTVPEISLHQLKSVIDRNTKISQNYRHTNEKIELRRRIEEDLRSLGYIE